jgi:hypothetical protein
VEDVALIRRVCFYDPSQKCVDRFLEQGINIKFCVKLSLEMKHGAFNMIPKPNDKFFFLLSLAPQPSIGLGLLKIQLNFLEASQQLSFLQGRVVSPTPNPHPGGPGLCIYIPQRQGGYPFYVMGIADIPTTQGSSHFEITKEDKAHHFL